MKITIITVAYNSAATIADTMRSIAVQAHANIEHIVIDGGSTDETLSLVRSHALPSTRIYSGPDKGIYDAMNKGVKLASGEFIGFLNADDVFDNADVVSSIARAAEESSADAMYGDLVYVSQTDLGRIIRHWRSGNFTRSRLSFGWMPPHPTLYVRRSRFEHVGEFDISFRIASDYDFILRLLGQPNIQIGYVPNVLVRMRTGGASNRSALALWNKSAEDLRALKKNKVGGVMTLLLKNLRKASQFIPRFDR